MEDSESSEEDASQTPEVAQINKNLKTTRDQIRQILIKVGKSLGFPESYAVSGSVPIGPPYTSIRLNNSGIELKFPLRIEEMEKISQNSTSQTSTWTASDFTILNPNWEPFISSTLLPLVLDELAVASPVEAILSKLVITYKPQSTASKKIKMDLPSCHWDDNHARDNIGFMIVQLPSCYAGGEILLGKGSSQINLSKMGGSGEFETFYAAFYSDADHAFLIVTEGVQTLLIYKLNLKLDLETKTDLSICATAKPVSFQEKASLLSGLLKEWGLQVESYYSNQTSESIRHSVFVPEKLVYISKHKFPFLNNNLVHDNLHPGDQAVADLLKDLTHSHNLTVLSGSNESDWSNIEIRNISLLATRDKIIGKIFNENKQLAKLPAFPCELILEEELGQTTCDDEDEDDGILKHLRESNMYNNGTFVIFSGRTFLKNLLAREPIRYGSIGKTL